MDKFLKPERLDVLPNSASAAREWNHWYRTFSAFLQSISSLTPNKLDSPINFVSPNVYGYIADCDSFEGAIKCLENLYVKPKNEVYARHLLATRRQREEESIDEFLQELQALSRDCNFNVVDAAQNRDSYIRDAFINGLLSNSIRQRLLENTNLNLSTSVDQARALDVAHKTSESYSRSPISGVTAAASEAAGSSGESSAAMGRLNRVENSASEVSSGPAVSADSNACASVNAKSRCFFCGGSRHNREQCPAKNAKCLKCHKHGHFAKVCRSAAFSASAVNNATLGAVVAASSDLLRRATMYILIDGEGADALIDTGSSESFISHKIAKERKLKVFPASGNVTMASSALSTSVRGCCVVDINVKGEYYRNTRLSVLPDLCCDVILGQDFMSQHSSVTVEFGGPKKNFSVNNSSTCSVLSATVEAPLLFANLPSDCRPIATKSRRFGESDRRFIKQEVAKMLSDGVIEDSTSSGEHRC